MARCDMLMIGSASYDVQPEAIHDQRQLKGRVTPLSASRVKRQ